MHPIRTDMQGYARFCADVLRDSAMKQDVKRIEEGKEDDARALQKDKPNGKEEWRRL